MSWTCTTDQSRVLNLAVAGARDRYALDWPTDGRDYGTPDDQAVPVDVVALVGVDIETGGRVGRAVGRVYVWPDGSLTGEYPALRALADLAKIGETRP